MIALLVGRVEEYTTSIAVYVIYYGVIDCRPVCDSCVIRLFSHVQMSILNLSLTLRI